MPEKHGFDLVQVEHLRGVGYAEFVRRRFPAMPLVWDSVDCISHLFTQAARQSRGLFGRFISHLDLKRTQQAEGRQVCRSDHVLVTSPIDRDALLALVAHGQTPAPVSILSNGVDLEYFRPPDRIQKEPETVVFSGKMSYHANSTMAAYLVDTIMPRVWQVKPNVKVAIVGKDPSPAVRKLAEHPNVVVTGTVDDLRPYLWKAGVAAVPLIYGAGIQNKILEAMAAGTPVIAATRTLSALQAEAGRDVLIADRPEEFAAQILRLMGDPTLYNDVRRNGLAYVEKFHNWHEIARQLMDIFRHTIEQKRGNKTP
jgi:glycosyltransferase involved in cell wall biosynthesis